MVGAIGQCGANNFNIERDETSEFSRVRVASIAGVGRLQSRSDNQETWLGLSMWGTLGVRGCNKLTPHQDWLLLEISSSITAMYLVNLDYFLTITQ